MGKTLSKTVVIVFLVLLVLGFTVPLINFGSDKQQAKPSEPRLCQTDSECFLACDDQPLAVLCSQNLCQQNTCNDLSPFPYKETPFTFQLHVRIDAQEILLANRSTSKDVFVKFTDSNVAVYALEFSLAQVLQKASIGLSSCLAMDGKQYCPKDDKEIGIKVNGNSSYLYGDYIPQEGDKIEISYG